MRTSLVFGLLLLSFSAPAQVLDTLYHQHRMTQFKGFWHPKLGTRLGHLPGLEQRGMKTWQYPEGHRPSKVGPFALSSTYYLFDASGFTKQQSPLTLIKYFLVDSTSSAQVVAWLSARYGKPRQHTSGQFQWQASMCYIQYVARLNRIMVYTKAFMPKTAAGQ